MLPSTNPKASAPRTSTFSVLTARPHEPLPTLRLTPREDRRTARGETWLVTPSFRGTLTPCLSPVSLAHRILVLPSLKVWSLRETRSSSPD